MSQLKEWMEVINEHYERFQTQVIQVWRRWLLVRNLKTKSNMVVRVNGLEWKLQQKLIKIPRSQFVEVSEHKNDLDVLPK